MQSILMIDHDVDVDVPCVFVDTCFLIAVGLETTIKVGVRSHRWV